MARVRPVSFEDRITLVEHLDELRTRILVSISAFAVAFCALLLAERQAAGYRQRTAAGRPDPDHLRRRRAIHHHRDDHRLRGDRDLAAGDPLPGLRLHAAGAHRPRAPGDRPLPGHGAGAVLRRGRSSATSSSCRPPPSSFSTSTRASSTSRSGRRTTTASSP